MKLEFHSFDLPLRHEFRISREAIAVQPTLIVELQEGAHRGYGEATTNRYYGVTVESMIQALTAVRGIVESHSSRQPEALWEKLSVPLADSRFALCAIDQAAHDLWGKIEAQPLHRLWGLDIATCPVSNYTIGIDTIENMVFKMRERPNWPIYKVKLGTEHDLEIVRQLRQHTNAPFRVDANCGWTVDETIANSRVLAGLNVEFIEQPLPAGDDEGQVRVYQRSALPLIADESCLVPEDVARCEDRFHGVNIKLVKCGGLTPARRMIKDARLRGLSVMIGCMTESTVGISAIAQLLPLLDHVDMDGAALLAEDIATGVSIVDGVCAFSKVNGTGAQLLGERTAILE